MGFAHTLRYSCQKRDWRGVRNSGLLSESSPGMSACRTPAVSAAAGVSGRGTLSAGGGSVGPGTGGALGPEVLEASAEPAAAQGEDGIGPLHSPMHAEHPDLKAIPESLAKKSENLKMMSHTSLPRL